LSFSIWGSSAVSVASPDAGAFELPSVVADLSTARVLGAIDSGTTHSDRS